MFYMILNVFGLLLFEFIWFGKKALFFVLTELITGLEYVYAWAELFCPGCTVFRNRFLVCTLPIWRAFIDNRPGSYGEGSFYARLAIPKGSNEWTFILTTALLFTAIILEALPIIFKSLVT